MAERFVPCFPGEGVVLVSLPFEALSFAPRGGAACGDAAPGVSRPEGVTGATIQGLCSSLGHWSNFQAGAGASG
jgi:hypothetical protein